MLTFISCAKTMTEKTPTVLPTASSPLFIEEARHIALSMTAYKAGSPVAPSSWNVRNCRQVRAAI